MRWIWTDTFKPTDEILHDYGELLRLLLLSMGNGEKVEIRFEQEEKNKVPQNRGRS